MRMTRAERALLEDALADLVDVTVIVEDCRSGPCPIELDEAPAPLRRAVARLEYLLGYEHLEYQHRCTGYGDTSSQSAHDRTCHEPACRWSARRHLRLVTDKTKE